MTGRPPFDEGTDITAGAAAQHAPGDAGARRPQVCVGGIVVEAGHLLMVQRATSPGIGRWSIPGGKVESGETLADALRREIAEETGLDVRVGQMIGWVELIGGDHHFVILDFRCSLPVTQELRLPPPRAGDEEIHAGWVRLEEVPGLPLVDGVENFLREHEILGTAG